MAEIRFARSDGRFLQLTLRGVRTVASLIEVLPGFDDFEIVSRENITPYAEFERYLCRFYRDDDHYETVIDGFETEETEPEQTRCSEPADGASVDNLGSVAPGH